MKNKGYPSVGQRNVDDTKVNSVVLVSITPGKYFVATTLKMDATKNIAKKIYVAVCLYSFLNSNFNKFFTSNTNPFNKVIFKVALCVFHFFYQNSTFYQFFEDFGWLQVFIEHQYFILIGFIL